MCHLLSRRPAAPFDAVRFVLGGDGVLAEELEEYARRVGAGPELLEFAGPVRGRAALRAFLWRLDVFLYPTTCDALGYVVIEAMAAALPVISTAICAMAVCVYYGQCAVLELLSAVEEV